MKTYPFLLALLLSAAFASAQTPEQEAVKKPILTFFEGMAKADTNLIKSTLAPGMLMQTIATRNGIQLRTDPVSGFLRSIASAKPGMLDERISFERIDIDGILAHAWTPYRFYINGNFSHCGYNSFHLVKYPDGWKIAGVIDTRRPDNCPPEK